MGNLNRFDEPMDDEMNKPAACAVCEAMLPDAVDGALSEAEQRLFDKHVAGCVACAEELAEAQRGAAWLQMLKGHTPEPSANLLSKILAQTTGAEAAAPAPQIAQAPATHNVVMMPALLPQEADFSRPAIAAQIAAKSGGKLIEFRRKITQIFTIENAHLNFQPRLAMTAAMAFFSVALTLNMTGVRLNNLKMADLKPSALRRTVVDTTASAARSFHSMRVVYQVESKLDDLQGDSRADELIHSATPYAAPSRRSDEPQQQKNHQNDSDQQKPQGHSDLKFLPIRAEQPSEKGA